MPIFAVERYTLGNGLRVVISVDPSAAVVGVALVIGAGVRAERPGESGYAHLLEHVLFHGDDEVGQMALAGGTSNAGTTLDFTSFYQCGPTFSLDAALAVAARRLATREFRPDGLARHVEVVKQEVSSNVDVPYGGFPMVAMPGVLFTSFANAHDGYADFTDLDVATPARLAALHQRHYGPANAVLAICGDVHTDALRPLVERHFGVVEARMHEPIIVPAEPDLTSARSLTLNDPRVPAPAVCLAWRVPDPLRDLSAYLPWVLVADILGGGPASRLQRRLCGVGGPALGIRTMLGLTGEAFEIRDPTAMLVVAYLRAGTDLDRLARAVTEECERLADAGPDESELEATRERLVGRLCREMDPVVNRALVLAIYTVQRDDPAFINALPSSLLAVTPEQVRAAARQLRPRRRATLQLVGGGL
jgi:zinc protease